MLKICAIYISGKKTCLSLFDMCFFFHWANSSACFCSSNLAATIPNELKPNLELQYIADCWLSKNLSYWNATFPLQLSLNSPPNKIKVVQIFDGEASGVTKSFIFSLVGKKCLHWVFLLARLWLSLGRERGNGVGKDESHIAFHAQWL